MLFFFELFLFVLAMLTLALGEFVSRGLALVLWGVVTAFAIGGYFLAYGALRPMLARSPELEKLAEEAASHSDVTPEGRVPPFLDVKWARTLLYNWRRTIMLLLLGLVAVGAWYWFGG
jgi:hypothetical protein